jgi:HEAT repeat protein
MRRTIIAVLTLAAVIFLLGPIGCGRKAKTEAEESAGAAPAPNPARKPADKTNPPEQPIGGEWIPFSGVPPYDPNRTDPMAEPMTVQPPQPTPMLPRDVKPKDPGPGVIPAVRMPGVPPKDPPKDPPSSVGSLPKEPEWPKEIGGKGANAYIKDLFDLDPAIREVALRTLPGFGPPVRKATAPDGKMTLGKALLIRMDPGKEFDPGVRVAAYACAAAIGFEEEKDEKEAIRLLGIAVDRGAIGGQTRLQAIQTLATFGPKAEAAIPSMIGQHVVQDPSHETRRSLAAALGQIAYDEKTGPNPKALECLTKYLISDASMAVRLEAMQALVVLGPPIHKIKLPDPQNPARTIDQPVPDPKAAKVYLDRIKARLAPQPKPSEGNVTGLVEPNRQVEIWGRVVLIRFDPATEITPENLDGIARYISGSDYGAKIQALAALGVLGEIGSRRIDEVVKVLTSDDLSLVSTAVAALVSMGPAAKPAIPDLEKLEKKFEQMRDERVKKLPPNLTPQQVKDLTDAMPEEQLRRGVSEAIKYIKNGPTAGPSMEKKS